jgi:hypothetical protein
MSKAKLRVVKCKTRYFDYVMNRTKEELRDWAARMDSDMNKVNEILDKLDLVKRPTKEIYRKALSEIFQTVSKWH